MDVDDVIQHAAYDPVARHRRYLEKRQLKGRLPAVPPKAGQGSRVVDSNAPMSTIHTSKAHQDAMARQRQSAGRQIAAIQGRLNNLKSHLKDLLAQQKAEKAKSSSSKSSTSTASKSGDTKSSTGATKPQSAKQKQAAKENVKKAQEASAAAKKAAPDQKPAELPLEDQIVKTRAVISVVESKLKTAIEQSSTRQTASNGR